MSLRLYFNDHGMVGETTSVARLDIDRLLAEAAEFRPVRVRGHAEPFDRAVLHLEEDELRRFLAGAPGEFLALRVTTQRGIPTRVAHHVEAGRVVLAVRRMGALRLRRVWTAFLRADRNDVLAAARGALEAISDDARPLLALVPPRDEWLSRISLLCRLNPGVAEWRRLLDDLPRRTAEGPAPFPGAEAGADAAERLLLDELVFEGVLLEESPAIVELVRAIARETAVDKALAEAAAASLRDWMQ